MDIVSQHKDHLEPGDPLLNVCDPAAMVIDFTSALSCSLIPGRGGCHGPDGLQKGPHASRIS